MPQSLAVLGGKSEAVLSYPRARSRSAEWCPWKKGHLCVPCVPAEGPWCDWASPLSFPSLLSCCQHHCQDAAAEEQRLLQWDVPLWALWEYKQQHLRHCPKPSWSSLSFRQFILIQENKVVKFRSQLYNTNTLQLPCIHTNMKRLEPSYFLYKLDITQLWSRYPFLSETFWPKITIPLAQLNVFIETHHQHFTAHLKNRCLQLSSKAFCLNYILFFHEIPACGFAFSLSLEEENTAGPCSVSY